MNVAVDAPGLKDEERNDPVAAIETIDLRKTYGRLTAVDDLNLIVPRGSIFALIGPNGAGKTTTFHILTTLLTPSSGVAMVMGHEIDEKPYEVRKLLGFMPDYFGVYDDVRVSEYLEFFASAYGIEPGPRRRITADLLELVDLTGKADAFVESLSRGMKQRLGLARAMVHDPDVLILDEPASGLDPRARVEFLQLMMELKSMGKTILISSHILPELEEVCTDVGILEAGRLLVQGAPAQIVAGTTQLRAFKVRLAGDVPESAEALIRSDPLVRELEFRDGSYQLAFCGDDEAAGLLLARLVQAKLKVVEFAEVPAGLEELFMNVTKGQVQ